ncbi:hypothetical protein JXL19_04790 [bacterium]|nr:hypothetical protein [bacterium]
MQSERFCFSGTLGDAFIVYCKLYDHWKKTGKNIKLTRYDRNVYFDNPISELFAVTPFIEYQIPCIYVKNKNELIQKIKSPEMPYINACWFSQNDPFPQDPPYIKMDPYPESFIEPFKNIGHDPKINIGIQLHSGKRKTNFKGFSIAWLKSLRRILPDSRYNILLLGTGDGYNKKRLDLFCRERSITNLVGKLPIKEWLRNILSLDFFITFEGFAAFFAMSQRIHSLVFYTTNRILVSVHPAWRKDNHIIMLARENNILIKAIHKYLFKANFLSPLPADQVKSFIDLKVEYISCP